MKNRPIKYLLACLLAAISQLSFSQEIKNFDLSLTVSTGSKKYLKQIDSVILRNDITKEEWIFDKLQTKDSVFKIEEVALGKYRLIVFQKGWVVPFIDVVACSSCSNKVSLRAQSTTNNMVFDRVFIGPHYEPGFKQLAADFMSALTKDELKTLKKAENKLKVRCFITANGKLSDVLIEQETLSPEVKMLIKKGFQKTTKWKSAFANGKPCDDYIPLSVDKLID